MTAETMIVMHHSAERAPQGAPSARGDTGDHHSHNVELKADKQRTTRERPIDKSRA